MPESWNVILIIIDNERIFTVFLKQIQDKLIRKILSPIKIIHIAPTPFFADRGCHIRIRNEIYSLHRQPVSIILCTYHHGKNIKGIDIRRIPRIPGYTKLDAGYSPFKFVADILLFFLVLKTVWQERPDILHAHLHEGVLVGWAVRTVLFWRHLPLIMDMQGSLSGELSAYGACRRIPFLLKIFRLTEKLICRLPDFFFCSSEASRILLIKDFHVDERKISLLQDIVPEEIFQDQSQEICRRNNGIPLNRKVLIYTGSLLEGKGIGYVLEAMRALSSKREDLFWVLVGYPIENTKAFLEQHMLSAICLLPGQVPYSDLSYWLAAADIALEPKSEDSGEASGKLLHYMAAALPVVCFPTVNNSEILSGTGFFAENISQEAFTQAIVEALDDRSGASARGRKNRTKARAGYSAISVAEKLYHIYSNLDELVKSLKR